MIKQKQNIIDSLLSVAVVVAFFLIISAFSDSSIIQDKVSIKHQLAVDLGTVKTNATEISRIHLPSFAKEWVLVFDYRNLKLSNHNLRLISENNKTKEAFNSLQFAQLKIAPTLVCRYFYHLYSTSFRELPIA